MECNEKCHSIQLPPILTYNTDTNNCLLLLRDERKLVEQTYQIASKNGFICFIDCTSWYLQTVPVVEQHAIYKSKEVHAVYMKCMTFMLTNSYNSH